MKLGYPRVIAYAAIVCVAAVALVSVLARLNSRPDEPVLSKAAVSLRKQSFDTLGKGESLQRALRRGGLSDSAAILAVQAASMLDERRIPAGMPITIGSDAADSAPSEVVLQVAIDRLLRLKRTGSVWTGALETLPWKTDTIVVTGTIVSSVSASVDASARGFLPSVARMQLTQMLAEDVYGYKIDMTRELRKGDEFKLLAERSIGPSGAVHIGPVLAATFSLSGSVLTAVRFTSKKVAGDYFDEEGKSMRTAFLRYPVAFNRISSRFGNRLHPILGYTRAHRGTDYAADAGTPVKSIGDGMIVGAGSGDGYGNMVEVRHPNGYVTRYGHLQGFAKGMHSGVRVKMGQVIGYVGSTGIATGPHLHFEVLINGEQRDSYSAFKRSSGAPIPTGERPAFQVTRNWLLERFAGVGHNLATGMNQVVGQR